MNRETKRIMKREEARKQSGSRPQVKPQAPPTRERTKPRQFVKEVGAELQKVQWPSRQEVVGYSLVVLVASVIVAALIFVMDYVFTRGVLALFDVNI